MNRKTYRKLNLLWGFIKFIFTLGYSDKYDIEQLRKEKWNQMQKSRPFINIFLQDEKMVEREKNKILPYNEIKKMRKKGTIDNNWIDRCIYENVNAQNKWVYSTDTYKRLSTQTNKTSEYYKLLAKKTKEANERLEKKKRKRR